MTMELWMLVGVVMVFFAIILVQSVTLIAAIGPTQAAGNREEVPALLDGLAGRAQRAVANHLEGLALFAPLVLLAGQAGISTPMTILATQIYLGSRIVHALSYILGVIWVRTFAFAAGILALVQLLVAIYWG